MSKKQPAKRGAARIGERAIESSAKRAIAALFDAVKKPNSNRAYEKAVRSIAHLRALAHLFEDAAARNYRIIRLGTKGKRSAIFAQRVR